MSTTIEAALDQLSRGRRLRRRLPGIGFVYIERPVPFLCVYRKPLDVEDRSTEKLVTGFPAYFIASADRANREPVRAAIGGLATLLAKHCGSVLVIEVFSGERLRVLARPEEALDPCIKTLVNALDAPVEVVRTPSPGPPELPELPIFGYLALEIEPTYRSPDQTEAYPSVLGALRRKLDIAIRQTVFDRAKGSSPFPLPDADVLGRHSLVKAAREVDASLAGVSDSLGYLLLVTPTNTERAWQEFSGSGFEREPEFRYRPLHIDPELLKKKLYDVHLEHIEDPTLTLIFREKQEELDRMISMLVDRGKKRFLWGSLQVFGDVDPDLGLLAQEIARHTETELSAPSEPMLNANEFADLARDEIAHYRAQWPKLTADVVVRSDVPNLMTLNGHLMVNQDLCLGRTRARALIQHEIGTHLVTYYNGAGQRLKHLGSGFAGYEALQEGLAVLAEYLTGGLSHARLRVIAARVLAVQTLLEGAGFVDTFRMLQNALHCGKRAAFGIAMRVHRSGGLTKDAIYLRGLGDLLGHLAAGGQLEELLVGKVGIQHVPLVHELRLRGIVEPPRLRPRYLDDPAARARLSRLANGARVIDLVQERD
jgi:uncharacterized protein (TIGR02421 family)